MKKQILFILLSIITLSSLAIDPPGLPFLPDGAKPDTILLELGDSTRILIISESYEEFSALKSMSFDTVINALIELLETEGFQYLSDSLIEFELAQQEFDEAMEVHEVALLIHEKAMQAHDLAIDEHERIIELQHLKELEHLGKLEELEEHEMAKVLEQIEELEELYDEDIDVEYEDEHKNDQIMITTNVGVGLVRDRLSPTADLVLSLEIKKYYYAAIGNMNFTFEQRADESYRTLNNIFVGVEFGRRFNKEESNLGFTSYFNNVGLSYLVQKQGSYFGDNTFKLYYGLDVGPVIIQPQLITTDNFKDWFPSLGIRVKL